MWKANVLVSLATLAISAYVLLHSFDLQYTVEFGPGPGFFPRWIAIGLLVLSVVYLAANLHTRERGDGFPISRQAGARTLGIFTTLTVAVALMETLGFTLSMGLFMLVVVKVFEARSWTYSIAVSAVSVVTVFLLFGVLFEVPLPQGIARI